MWRVLGVVEQMARSLNDATRYLEEALGAIDGEMTALQARLHADAAALRSGITDADLNPADQSMLLATLDRIENTADSVASFAHRQRDSHGHGSESPSAT